MKIGDLVMWSYYASMWSNGPTQGDIAGILVRYLPRRKKRRGGKALTPERVEVVDFEGDSFIVRATMVEASR